MYYRNPTNLQASINRFFNETRAVRGRYGNAGDLAAAVQRPAAQYRGRYGQRSAEADAILRALGGDAGGQSSPSAATATAPDATVPAAGGLDRRALLLNYLQERGNPNALLGLAAGLQQADATAAPSYSAPQAAQQATPTGPSRGAGGRMGSPDRLLELFYNGPGGVNVDNGRRVGRGFVSGHTNHVHVAAGPKTIQSIARIAQEMGLSVRELAPFDKVDPVHTRNSFHYRNMAADISGDPRKMAEFSRRVARAFGL